MISAFLMGGLGNQMFQISAAYSLAIDNNDSAVFNFDACYTPLQGNTSNKYKNNIFKNVSTSNFLKIEKIYEEFSHKYSKINYQENLLIKGYFQSEKYFANNSNKIKDLFYINKEKKEQLIEKYKLKEKQTVSVHIRRGDYLKNPKIHPTCSVDFYLNAFSKFPNHKFVFVSDDIQWVKDNLKGKNFIYSEETNEIDDFTLLNSCDNHIISNSTFSWWAAYLNKKEDKIIICPERFFGPDGPQDQMDIYPNNWIKL